MTRQNVLAVLVIISLVLIAAYVLWGQPSALTCTAGSQVGDHCTKDGGIVTTASP